MKETIGMNEINRERKPEVKKSFKTNSAMLKNRKERTKAGKHPRHRKNPCGNMRHFTIALNRFPCTMSGRKV